MVTLHEVITFLVSMQISISSLQTHNVNRCGRSRHLARKLSLRRKRSSPNVFEMAATETITSIILIKLIRVSLGTVRHPRRFKIVVIDIQITLKQMLRDFIGIRVNRAKKSGMVNITSSVNSRERSGINTILHELNPLFTINVTMMRQNCVTVFSFSKNHFSSPSGRWSIVLLISSWGSTLEHCANSSINFSVTDTNSSRTSEAALWPSTYISPLSNSTPCIRKDRISSKSLLWLPIWLWKPSIGV